MAKERKPRTKPGYFPVNIALGEIIHTFGMKPEDIERILFPIAGWEEHPRAYVVYPCNGYEDTLARWEFHYHEPMELSSGWVNKWYEANSPFILGDILWVQQEWWGPNGIYTYRVDRDPLGVLGMPWKPAEDMPKDAAKTFFRVVDIRPVRLKDDRLLHSRGTVYGDAKEIKRIGEATNAMRHQYETEAGAALWVWRIGVQKVEKPADF